MAPARRLSIVLPAYNEAARIDPALDDLFAYMRGRMNKPASGESPGALPEEVEVLVVDDGSSDATAELVQARTETRDGSVPGVTLRLLRVPHGGKGAAVRAGMLDATGDIAVFADADMATPPEQLPLLVGALKGHDVAFGTRFQPDGTDMRATQPWHRRLLGRAFHVFASLWATGPVRDTQCGFKGFTRTAARDLFGSQRLTSIVFDVELIYLARRRGYRIAIVPIRWEDKQGSRMRARPGLAVRVAWDLIRIRFIHRSVNRVATAEGNDGA